MSEVTIGLLIFYGTIFIFVGIPIGLLLHRESAFYITWRWLLTGKFPKIKSEDPSGEDDSQQKPA
jgi:hypothetical protein